MFLGISELFVVFESQFILSENGNYFQKISTFFPSIQPHPAKKKNSYYQVTPWETEEIASSVEKVIPQSTTTDIFLKCIHDYLLTSADEPKHHEKLTNEKTSSVGKTTHSENILSISRGEILKQTISYINNRQIKRSKQKLHDLLTHKRWKIGNSKSCLQHL